MGEGLLDMRTLGMVGQRWQPTIPWVSGFGIQVFCTGKSCRSTIGPDYSALAPKVSRALLITRISTKILPNEMRMAWSNWASSQSKSL